MRIAVLAAGGHTGRRVVDALRRRGADVVPLTRKDCDARDRAAVRAKLRGADGIVNLAGPFLANGLAPVMAARDEGIPYVDTTGEQAFMSMVRDATSARDPPVVNAMAYEYALGDLAARAHFPEGGDALHVLYRNRGTQPSAGTKKSILRVMGARTLSYEEGKLVHVQAARWSRTFPTADGPRTGMSFAGGEVLTVPTHTPFRTVRTYVATTPANAKRAKLLAPLARVALRGALLRAAERYVDAKHRAPENERARGEVHLVAEPSRRHVVVTTPDPYVATAELAAEAVVRLVGRTEGGALAPAVAFDARDMLDSLAKTLSGLGVTAFTPRGPKE